MKWIIIGLFVLAAICFGLGKWTELSAQSGDERFGSTFPYLLGAILFDH